MPLGSRHLLRCAAVGLPFVGLLVWVLVAHGAPLGMDLWWSGLVAGARRPLLVDVAVVVSDLGGGLVGGVVVPVLVTALLWRRRPLPDAAAFALASIVSAGLVQLVKHTVARPRPAAGLVTSDFGAFPSGHVANAATMTVVLLLLLRRRWLLAAAVLWPAVTALSRTVLDVHWLSDTIAGASLGALVALVTVSLMGRWTGRKSDRRGTEPVGALVFRSPSGGPP